VASVEAELHNQPDPAAFLVDVGGDLGSAWVVQSNAESSMLVTDYHVVRGAWEANSRHVTLKRSKQSWDATIEKVSTGNDLAVLRVQQSFPTLARASGRPAVGDPVMTAGNPLGLESTVSAGIVRAGSTGSRRTTS
jgi:S1-C subfamily serine protease